MSNSIFDKKTCSICMHSKVCKAHKKVSEIISDWEQFSVKLRNFNQIYLAMADMCRHYGKLPPFKAVDSSGVKR